MRPKHLTIEGFTSFRDLTEIDFQETDLLALTGPTGSGKSSILDAMIFALYGRIPRLGDRTVKDAISEGMRQTDVALDFYANDQLYRVTRTLRINKDGNILRNTGSLERSINGSSDDWEAVVSEHAADLVGQVTEIIGLSSDQFKKCVTIPQGEFAAFLDAQPAIRQQLIKDLIGVQLYDKIRELAKSRSDELQADLHHTNSVLNNLADVSKNSVEQLKSRLDQLSELDKTTREKTKEKASLTAKVQQHQDETESLEEMIETLKGITVPTEATKLSKEVDQAESDRKEAVETQRSAQKRSEKAGQLLDQLGDKADLEIGRRETLEVSDLELEIDKFKKELEGSEERTEESKESVSRAEEQVSHAQELLKEAERSDLASKLRSNLELGEHCPVCDQIVTDMPALHKHSHVSECESKVADAKKVLKNAESKHRKQEAELTKMTAQQQQRQERLGQLKKKTKGVPKLDVIESTLKKIGVAEKEHKAALDEVRKYNKAIERSESRLQELQENLSEAWNEFESARSHCAVRNPPPREENDLESSWNKLSKWAKKESASVQAEQVEVIEAEEELKHQLRALIGALESEFDEHEVEFDEEDPGQHLGAEIGETRARLTSETKDLKQKNSLKRKKSQLDRKQKVASALTDHLRSNRFERWLLNSAFDRLAVDASDRLKEMSSDQYSLVTDDNFGLNIIDHANADASRSVKTLSGGETFLASLALALSLSENVAEMGANSGVSLESLFLDEGFGTLDDESLDVVAAAIEEMGSKGRMVGIVTHIEKLAERMPVRLNVKKVANASVVKRVAA